VSRAQTEGHAGLEALMVPGDRILARNDILLRQAPMTVEQYMTHARTDIDAQFGEDYAAAHPELLGAYMQSGLNGLWGRHHRSGNRDVGCGRREKQEPGTMIGTGLIGITTLPGGCDQQPRGETTNLGDKSYGQKWHREHKKSSL
jgi:hypothetical protein